MEILDCVDEKGEPTGQRVTRKQAHREGIRHRTAHVWLLRKNRETIDVLLQKRSDDKDSFPKCWDISSAGHIPAGADYKASALRELQEELGVTARPEELMDCGLMHFTYQGSFYGEPFVDDQICRIYILWRDVPESALVLQTSEISKACWRPLDQVIEAVTENRILNCMQPSELERVASWARRRPD